jgi:hypothetical protein
MHSQVLPREPGPQLAGRGRRIARRAQVITAPRWQARHRRPRPWVGPETDPLKSRPGTGGKLPRLHIPARHLLGEVTPVRGDEQYARNCEGDACDHGSSCADLNAWICALAHPCRYTASG